MIPLGDRWEAVEKIIDGQRALVVVPALRDDDPPVLREAMVRRRITTLTGVCPCGAVRVLQNRAQRRADARAGRASYVPIVHADDCPATDETARRLLREATL